LVRVVVGEVFDVAVDIRKTSPTFGQWVSAILSAENKKQLWLPSGFAHGFVTLSDAAEVLYKTTDTWSAEHERGIVWNDPDLAITWPIANPTLSAKDTQGKRLKEAEIFA
jgi:dTDP-4-dehydrorhamnose 3,5-epimerase